MPRNLSSADDLLEYARHLQQKNDERDQTMLRLQSMWEQPIMTTETGRVVFKDNEPWTAARLSVSMLNAGRLAYKITLPPSAPNQKEASDPASSKYHELRSAVGDLERFLLAHYHQTDFERWLRAESTFRRGWSYHAFVHGWHGGINLVLDHPGPDQWPIQTELWSPLDTFRAMDGGTDIVHVTRKQWGDLDRGFGHRRPEKIPVSGFEFKPPPDVKDDSFIEVLDIWNHEVNAVACVYDNRAYWLKPPMEHKKKFNPAWLNPIDAPPFKGSSNKIGSSHRYAHDAESNKWLGFVGQSPMLGWENNWKVMCQLAEMIAGNVERWGKALVLVKTRDGRYSEFDLMNPEANAVDLETIVEVIQPNKFPVDERVWYENIKGTVQKASYSPTAYGMGGAESERLMSAYRDANSYIIAPLVQQAEMTYEFSALSILRQLDDMKGGPGYKRKYFPAISQDASGARLYEYFNVKNLPKGAMVTASLRGAGPPQDKFQALLAVTQALNSPNAPLPHAVLLEEFLDRPDPASDIKQLFNESVARNKTVEEKVAPLFTLTRMADQFRRMGNDRGNEIADLLIELRSAYVEEQKATALGTKKKAAAMSAAPTELPTGQAGGEDMMDARGLEGDAQVDGLAAPGAPVAGVDQPATGSDPSRGMLMALADRLGG